MRRSVNGADLCGLSELPNSITQNKARSAMLWLDSVIVPVGNEAIFPTGSIRGAPNLQIMGRSILREV